MSAQVELARRTNAREADLLSRGFASGQTVYDTSLNPAQMETGIAERLLDDGAVVGAGTPVATIIEVASPRFHVGLDPATADMMRVGIR